MEPKPCEGCIHWHPRAQKPSEDTMGDCDKVAQRDYTYTPFAGNTIIFRFKGHTYWWETYDNIFHCYEGKECDR